MVQKNYKLWAQNVVIPCILVKSLEQNVSVISVNIIYYIQQKTIHKGLI